MRGFDSALNGFAALDEDALSRPWTWRDGRMDVRYALYRTLEEAQEALVRVAAGTHPESRRILAMAPRALGNLRGLLLGLPAALLDTLPRAGEWSIRETFRHMLLVERRYALQTRYAIDRTDAEPVRIPDDRLPTAAQLDASGEIDTLLGRLGDARAESNRWLGDVAPAAMARPTVWAHYTIDVRFRLHRFAAHLLEHTIQCEKILDALGHRQTEGRRIVRQICAAIGELEGLGALAEARDVETRLVERFASVVA
jgi:DinB superfamily